MNALLCFLSLANRSQYHTSLQRSVLYTALLLLHITMASSESPVNLTCLWDKVGVLLAGVEENGRMAVSGSSLCRFGVCQLLLSPDRWQIRSKTGSLNQLQSINVQNLSGAFLQTLSFCPASLYMASVCLSSTSASGQCELMQCELPCQPSSLCKFSFTSLLELRKKCPMRHECTQVHPLHCSTAWGKTELKHLSRGHHCDRPSSCQNQYNNMPSFFMHQNTSQTSAATCPCFCMASWQIAKWITFHELASDEEGSWAECT